MFGEEVAPRSPPHSDGYSADGSDSGGSGSELEVLIQLPERSARCGHGVAGGPARARRGGSWWRALRNGILAACVVGAAFLGAAMVARGSMGSRPDRLRALGSGLGRLSGKDATLVQESQSCGAMLQNFDLPGNDIAVHFGVKSASGCCQRCLENENCVLWVWGEQRDQAFSDTCYLKGGFFAATTRSVEGVVQPGWAAGSVARPAAAGDGAAAAGGATVATVGIAPLTTVESLGASSLTPQAIPEAADNGPRSTVLASIMNLVAGILNPKPPATATTPPQTTVAATYATPPTFAPPAMYATPPTFTPPTFAPPETTTTTEACGLLADGVEYPGNDIDKVKGVDSAESCCQQCAKSEECLAWSWQVSKSTCFLKGAHPRGAITKLYNQDFKSGMPTQVGRSIETMDAVPGGSLYCFALMLPDSYEVGLLEMQYEEGISLFACDEYAVFTNQHTKVAGEVETIRVDVDLNCGKGGEFGTVLNTGIFLRIWDKLWGLGRYSLHDWTVKVDPDTAFSPSRLRSIVGAHRASPEGVYLNNCRLGMHGPLEVLSRGAVRAFQGGRPSCEAQLAAKCGGPCEWGEDMWIDQCLQLLGVRREPDALVLLEEHCEPPYDWADCTSPGIAGFHPFKEIERYKACASRMDT